MRDQSDNHTLKHVNTTKPAVRIQPPRLLGYIQNLSTARLSQLMDHTFSSADDLLYDLSQRASSNNEERLYFEAMRELRIKKARVTREFSINIEREFDELIAGHSQNRKNPLADTSNTLSIVESDTLEVELASSSMTGRTRGTYTEELYELGMRLDHLLIQIRVNSENNPIDPQQIVSAFVKSSVEFINTDIKIRLILFKVFEKQVLKQLAHIYRDSNRALIEAGILPTVPRNLTVNEDGSRQKAEAVKPEQDTPHLDHRNTDLSKTQHALKNVQSQLQSIQFSLSVTALTSLMSALRSQRGPDARNYTPLTHNPGPSMDSLELSKLLTKSQILIDRQLSKQTPSNVVPLVINQLLAKRDPSAPQAVAQTSEDIINLVSMFFEDILKDGSIPRSIQSLICRLQIPILKIAIKDKDLLSNESHPARKLINAITSAGLSLDDSQNLEQDPIYRKIVDTVQMVNRQFKDELSIFSEAEEEIVSLLNHQAKRASITEKRTMQTEEGKDKLNTARHASQTALFEKMKTATLPDDISLFLSETWLQVLTITCIKHGTGSDRWIEFDQLIGDLIWLCQSHNDERSLLRKARLQPDILERIQIGLEAAIVDEQDREEKIRHIEHALVSLDSHTNDPSTYRTLNAEQIFQLGRDESSEMPWEEMSALEKQKSKYHSLTNDFYEKAKHILVGTWLNYTDNKSGKTIRCKLSTKLDSDTYIFVNRLGLKTIEKSRRDFAYDLQLNHAKPIDTRPMFERVMSGIVSQINHAA